MTDEATATLDEATASKIEHLAANDDLIYGFRRLIELVPLKCRVGDGGDAESLGESIRSVVSALDAVGEAGYLERTWPAKGEEDECTKAVRRLIAFLGLGNDALPSACDKAIELIAELRAKSESLEIENGQLAETNKSLKSRGDTLASDVARLTALKLELSPKELEVRELKARLAELGETTAD